MIIYIYTILFYFTIVIICIIIIAFDSVLCIVFYIVKHFGQLFFFFSCAI